MDVVKNPASDVFAYWQTKVRPIVGDNFAMDLSSQIVKVPYARIFMMGSYGRTHDLEGNEVATNMSFQVESFAGGKRSLTDVYRIDSASHQAMVDMGFMRTYGPELINNNNDPLTRRVVSRYTRIYTGYLNT